MKTIRIDRVIWPVVVAAVLLAGETGAAFRNPDGVAVIIGNRAYQYDVPEVTYAHRDAEAFRRYVVDVLGFDPENVIHAKDADKATMERVFGNKDNLTGSNLWRLLHPDGLSDVVVFYSGHGIPGLNDKRGYLLPVNAHPDSAELNGYPIDVLYANLVKLKDKKAVRSVHVFLDACFSGDSGGGRLIGSTSAIRVAPLNDRMKSDRDSVLMFKNEAPVHKEQDDKSLRGYYKEFFRPFIDHSNPKIDYDKLLRMYYRSFADHFNPKLEYGEFVERTYRLSVKDPSFPEKMAQDLWKLYRDSISRDDFEKLIGIAPKHDDRDEGDPGNTVEETWQTESEGIDRLTILTAASGKEVASWDKDAKHGLFTHHLLDALYGGGDVDGDGQVTAAEAKAYLGRHMTRAARRTFGRVQNADLRGEKTAVLARAVGGMFPKRPLLVPARQAGQQQEAEARQQTEEARQKPELKKLSLASLKQQMIHIEGGAFTMGCMEEQSSCDADEKPVHRVQVRSFALSKYEVTQALWEVVMGENPSEFENCALCPVENVSWEDIQTFLKKLNNLTGERYRLPTEAEWEYAARGGQQSRGYQYAGSNEPGLVAWYRKNSGDRVHPVGEKQPNELGLYDMSGNVLEWVEDCWNESYSGAPSDGRAWQRGKCDQRVVRGGSWSDATWTLRSAYRNWIGSSYRGIDVGFRVARTCPAFHFC